jgi:NADPH:quinone reductase-like Zn-dependent oxidoreductase
MYTYVSVPNPGGPEVLELREGMAPEPKPGEARIRVETVGVAFPDTLIRTQTMVPPDIYPVTPGYDAAGIVEKLGEGVTDIAIGQRVIRVSAEGEGGYATMLCHPAADLVVVPDGVEPGAAVSVGMNGIMAYQMVHRLARVSSGERVLIHGAAGGIGHLMAQLCRMAGAAVYGTASGRKQDVVASLGATPIDYQNEDVEARIRELAGDGVDVVFDCVGGEHVQRSLRMLRITGRLIAYGSMGYMSGGQRNDELYRQYQDNPPTWSLRDLYRSNKLITAYTFYLMKTQQPDWFRADLAAMLELVAQRRLTPIIGARVPFSEVRRAHELADASAVSGKIVLDVES